MGGISRAILQLSQHTVPEQSAQGAQGSASVLLAGLQLVLALVLFNICINAMEKRDKKENV